MNSDQNFENVSNEDEAALLAMHLAGIRIVPIAMKTAIEMDLFEIMAKAGSGAHLSPSDLASRVGTENPDAAMMIERLLRLLVGYSVTTCKLVEDEKGREIRVYGLGPVGKKLVKDEDGVSIAPMVLLGNDKVIDQCWYHLKESIVGGGTAFEKAHGMQVFEYMGKDEKHLSLFNEMMSNHTTIVMRKILEVYKGFEGLNDVVVDVGGGLGANLALIVSKHPHLKAINFDLPHVVKHAPKLPGVEHVGGDMFTQVPQGRAILLKWILHDWNDEKCLNILKNCRDAIPESGKVILVESILPETPNTDLATKIALCFDVGMMGVTLGGKERTKKEFDKLAKDAGFASAKVLCRAYAHWVIELYKN